MSCIKRISFEKQKPIEKSFQMFLYIYFFHLIKYVTAPGCYHNDTVFANGSIVPTVEPCLNCKCVNTNLICALRVCPEQPIPPPRGCVIVQKRDTCCPYMTCSKLHTMYKGTDKGVNNQVVTYDRKWYEENIRNRIFSANSLQRRIDDDDEGSEVDGTQFHNDQSM